MIRVSFAFIFFAVVTVVIWASAIAFGTAQERQTTYRYIASALTPVAARQSQVTWKAPANQLVRPFTPFDADAIGLALSEAWRVLAIAQDTGQVALIADRFTGVAKKRAAMSVADATAHGGRISVLAQTARPIFFHKDGSLFQAKVEKVVARYLQSENKELAEFHITKDTGIVTLMNESNGWRVLSYERRAAAPIGTSSVGWSGKLNGMNYYPANSPWRDFWYEFDANEIAADFDTIASLGANSVRVFLTRDAFLGDDSASNIAKLEKLLNLARAKKLQLVPTLFDLKQDFGLGSWADDTLYLSRVLPVLSASNAVAFVDLKNEPDLDFEHHGKAKITAWLKSMLVITRTTEPDLPLTIGWSAAEHAAILAQDLDVVTYHDYAPIEGTAERFQNVQQKVGDMPILITEIGDSTFEAGLSFPGSEIAQAERLTHRLDQLQTSSGVFVWTLHDFPNVDPTVIGNSPWVKRLQASFGLIRSDGSEKPGAAAVRSHFTATN